VSEIDVSQYRLQALPDDDSDEDWDDDGELFGPDGGGSRPGGRAIRTASGCRARSTSGRSAGCRSSCCGCRAG
jgi:hypothetical protein